MTRYVAGIGARDAPEWACVRATELGSELAAQGWTLRSGGAAGMDSAFEQGWDLVGGDKQIFLPWKGYNGNKSLLYPPPQAAYELIDSMWSDVAYRTPGVRALFARNCQQILGPNLDEPSELVICWTKGGKIIGGTGRALDVAKKFDIQIINLAIEKLHLDLYGI